MLTRREKIEAFVCIIILLALCAPARAEKGVWLSNSVAEQIKRVLNETRLKLMESNAENARIKQCVHEHVKDHRPVLSCFSKCDFAGRNCGPEEGEF